MRFAGDHLAEFAVEMLVSARVRPESSLNGPTVSQAFSLINTYTKKSRNPQFWASNDLYVGQKDSAFISKDAEWNSTSIERTEMHV